MKKVARAALGLLSVGALIGLQMYGCSAADEPSRQPDNGNKSEVVPEQTPASSPGATAVDNRFADLTERFKAVDDLLEANPKDAKALEEVARLRAEVASRLNPLTTVQVSADHRVEFYEPVPGVALVHEWFSQGVAQPHSIIAGMERNSLAEVYTKLRPSEKVPEVLLAADKRALEPLNSLPPITEADVVGEGPAPLISKISSSCSEWTNAGGCPKNLGSGWCFCNLAGNFSKAVTTDFGSWSIAPFKGSVSLQLSVNGTVVLIDAIPQGEWHWWNTQSGWGAGDKFCSCGLWQACGTRICFRNHTGAVINATNDGYHYGGSFNL